MALPMIAVRGRKPHRRESHVPDRLSPHGQVSDRATGRLKVVRSRPWGGLASFPSAPRLANLLANRPRRHRRGGEKWLCYAMELGGLEPPTSWVRSMRRWGMEGHVGDG